MMQGRIRESLTRLRELVTGSSAGPPADLLAVAALLGREHRLRAVLSDAGTPQEVKVGLVDSLLDGRVGAPALDVVRGAVTSRWSHARDLPDALEAFGVQAAFAEAEAEGSLDRVEDELFRFGRTVAAETGLRQLLADPDVEDAAKVSLLRDLLGGRAAPLTLELLEHVVRSPRGRTLEEAIGELSALAAERTQEVVAGVRVAAPMAADQEQRLAAALGRLYGRPVRLQVSVDPTVLGGAVVTVGEEVIDGTVAHRLDQARRRMTG